MTAQKIKELLDKYGQREWGNVHEYEDEGFKDAVRLLLPLVEALEYYKKQCRPCNSHYAEHEEGYKNDMLQGCDCLIARQALNTLAQKLGG